MENTLTLLDCRGGLHGCRIMSTSGPRWARLLDGWTTINEDLDPDATERDDMCPVCSVRVLLFWMLDRSFGFPSRAWAMHNRENPESEKALFAWDLHPEGVAAVDLDNSMMDQGLAWRKR